MPIELITGAPGAGKTLYAVGKIRDAVGEGRPVYCNIDGIQIPEVEPLPEDWRHAPDGSLIVVDECHQRWPATGKPGRTGNEEITALDEHRHRGFDFIVMTQFPTKVHHQVREHINYHRHLMRPAGMKRTTIYTWGYPVLSPNDRQERDQADAEAMPYDKTLFPLYKSATLHTVKRQIPRKLKVIGTICAILFSFVAYRLMTGDGFLSGAISGKSQEVPETPPHIIRTSAQGAAEGQAAPPPPPRVITPPEPDGLNDWTHAYEVKPVGGCIVNASHCRCYSESMVPLDLGDFDCRLAASRPLPYRLVIATGGSGQGASIAPAPQDNNRSFLPDNPPVDN
jgi:zona occludens toxin (predicted ATPase)